MVHNSAPVELGEWKRAENESMGQVEVKDAGRQSGGQGGHPLDYAWHTN
jgi:hypothetical protein